MSHEPVAKLHVPVLRNYVIVDNPSVGEMLGSEIEMHEPLLGVLTFTSLCTPAKLLNEHVNNLR